MLSAVSAWWVHFVEQDVIFEGKRRSLIQGKVSAASSPLNSVARNCRCRRAACQAGRLCGSGLHADLSFYSLSTPTRQRSFSTQVHTETLLVSSSLLARPTSPPSLLTKLLHNLSLPTSLSLRSPAPPPPGYPRYSLKVGYVQLSSGGKSLIHEGEREVAFAVGEVFDEEGRMWVKSVEERVEEGVRGCVGV